MHILERLDAFDRPAHPKPVLALGNFDGVHLGHQSIFRHVVAEAERIGGTGMMFTFDPHPAQILNPAKAPLLLTTFEQKTRLISAIGVQVGLRVGFTDAFARQPPLDFIHDILCTQIGIHHLVVGYDFRFGHQRAGTVALLQEVAPTQGYAITVVPAIVAAGMTVSSSNIRQLVGQGKVADAARLLGRLYAIEGPVVEGFRRGRTIGFPTANVQSINDIIPQTGVYAVRVRWDDTGHHGVANIGYNPTFENQKLSVEVHVFDFDGDLYGKTIEVAFAQKIRDERKFDSLDALKAQIASDGETARAIHREREASH